MLLALTPISPKTGWMDAALVFCGGRDLCSNEHINVVVFFKSLR